MIILIFQPYTTLFGMINIVGLILGTLAIGIMQRIKALQSRHLFLRGVLNDRNCFGRAIDDHVR